MDRDSGIMLELPVDFFAFSAYVKTEIWNKRDDKFSQCHMVFDTGAWTTTIDTGIVLRVGYDLKDAKKVLVNGIGGVNIPAYSLILDNLRLGEMELGPVLVNVLDFPKEGTTFALLGLNVIKEFKVIADFGDKRTGEDKRNATFYLEPLFDISHKPALDNFIPSQSRFGSWAVSD